jgi:hypothetical protein
VLDGARSGKSRPLDASCSRRFFLPLGAHRWEHVALEEEPLEGLGSFLVGQERTILEPVSRRCDGNLPRARVDVGPVGLLGLDVPGERPGLDVLPGPFPSAVPLRMPIPSIVEGPLFLDRYVPLEYARSACGSSP